MGELNIYKRNSVLDIAKGIGIILVIFGHLTYSGQFARNIVYSFHMPLFFFISGYLFKIRGGGITFKRGLKKFVLPAYIVIVIDVIVRLIVVAFRNQPFPTIKVWISTLLLHGGMMINRPIWFLPILFLCTVIQSLIRKHKIINLILVVVCFLLSVFKLGALNFGYTPLCFLPAYPYFWAGVQFKKVDFNRTSDMNLFLKILIILLEAGIVILISRFNGETSIADLLYGKSFILFIVSGILGTDAVILFSSIIKNLRVSRFFELFGKHSVIIFITHYYLCRGIIPKLAQFTNTYDYLSEFWAQIIITILITAMYYPIVFLYDKYKISKYRLKKQEI